MLTRRGAASVVVGGLLTAGCAIHPVPENMTGVSTYEIVRHIRCETRKAAIESILDYLTDERNLNSDKKLGVDAHSHQVGLDYQKRVDETPSSIATFKPDLLTGQAKSVVDVVWDTGIAAYYDLTMTETNNIDPTLDLVRSLTKNTLKLGLTGNYDRMRKNERSFTTTDNFGDLIAKVPSDYCNGQIVQANMNYPVAGEIGMKRVIQDFLRLALFTELGARAADPTAAKAGTAPTMVEALDFTTTLGAEATPKLTFGAGAISDASLDMKASRSDDHKVTIGLALNPKGNTEISGIRSGIFNGRLAPTLITASVPAGKGQASQNLAVQAVDQFLTQKLFQPTIVINP
jgi:hypothetical protein